MEEQLGFVTECGKARLQELLTKPLDTQADQLRDRQKTILSYRNQTKSTVAHHEELFQRLHTIEPSLQSFLHPTSLEKEAIQQILFSGNPHLQILNTVPYLLAFISLWKQYIVPALAICMPIFFFLLPYVTMRLFYKLPITFDQYFHIFCTTVGIPHSLHDLQWKQAIQLVFTSISLGQSIYQPVATSYHIEKIDKEIQEKTEALYQFREIFNHFYPDKSFLFEVEKEDGRRQFAETWDLSFKLQYALHMIGDVEVIHRIALHPNVRPVEFNSRGLVRMKHLVDPLLETSKPLSFYFTPKKRHSLLTGPNGGGKSTALRCILVNLLFAQRCGVCFGTETAELQLHPFDWIQSGLHLEDHPGECSLFEREVQFAASALANARQYPQRRGLLLFDELFHSTNPPDGERTATLFLQQVWTTPNLSSIISTHVFPLAESAPAHIQTLCVPAHKKSDGSLEFTYTLQPGICKVSSVDIVLQKCGFFPPGKPGVEKE